MSFEEDLDALRASLPGCRLAAYADLSARMVLRVSADKRPPRETVDALCDQAARCLDGPAMPSLFDGEPPYAAVVAGPTESHFFVRSLADASDGLILIVAEPVAQTDVWVAAQDLLDRQVAGEEGS